MRLPIHFKSFRILTLAIGLLFGAASYLPAEQIILRGGSVIDGSGSPARKADVAIEGDRVVSVATTIPASPS